MSALTDALRLKLPVFPMLSVAWAKRGSSLGLARYAPGGATLDDGAALGTVVPGGFAEIEYGTGLRGSTLMAATTSVKIVDVSRELASLLEKYEPRNSPAVISWASPALVPDDWGVIFTGIVYDWKTSGTGVELLLRTDDAAFKQPVPRPAFQRAEWSAAFDSTIFGTSMPLVLGIHDTFEMTNRGMVGTINIRYDEFTGFWWLASLGNLKSVRRVYVDGTLLSASSWTSFRGVYGGNLMTIISIPNGSQPEGGAVISIDCEGPDTSGWITGTTLTNPVAMLRTLLEEYVLRDNAASLWQGPHPRIDDASWSATEAYFESRDYECARVFGGEQGEGDAQSVVDSFLSAYPWTRAVWLENGKLALYVIHYDDDQIDASQWVEAGLLAGPGKFEYEPGDRKEVYSHVRQPFMDSNAEQKFETAYEAHDPASSDEPVMLVIENAWSQGRYNRA